VVVYEPAIPPLLRAIMTPPQSAYASQARQQAEQAAQQLELNRIIAEQRLAVQAAREAVREAAQQGRYF